MESHVNPQPTDAHIRISHQIHRELIRRKFTQRQRYIIDFILTLSWGCRKPSAIIPKLKDFELCGVRKNHIRQELEILADKRVVFWEKDAKTFQINKYYDQWEIDAIDTFDFEKMDQLINFNIKNGSPNLSKKVTEKGTLPHEINLKSYTFGNSKVTEKGTLPTEKVTHSGTRSQKRELKSYTFGNSKVTHLGTEQSDEPNHIKAFRRSKTSIKTSIKKGLKDIYSPTAEIVNYLNEKTGARYKPSTQKTKELIKARLNQKFTVEDFKTVIDKKCEEWIDSDMAKYLRPETLFGTKFEGYLNQLTTRSRTSTNRTAERNARLIQEIREEEERLEQARSQEIIPSH